MNKLVNLRLNDSLLKKIDGIVKQSIYSNRTEFIKHSLIDSVEDFETKEAIKRIEAGVGSAKRAGFKTPTKADERRVREEVGKELLKKYGLN
jgi:metal-responsive CopG/Arc/MetJ family transcriptional regulator